MNAKMSLFAVIPLLAGCGFAYGAGGYQEVYYDDAAHYDSYGGTYEYERVSYRRLPVPRSYLPAAGRCRVWLPGVGAGRQQRSGSCRALENRVPSGGWLLVRPYDQPSIVQLLVYDARRPGVRIRYVYDIRTRRRVNAY